MSQDLSFEALVTQTGATVSSERGALNAALKQIREAASELDDSDLALEIAHRAGVYRQMWPSIALTPTALAKHWTRIPLEAPKPAYSQSAPSVCATCGGHKMVTVGTRPAPNPPEGHGADAGFEECAPCPDCNPHADTSFWRVDGTRFTTPDPAQVRRMMNG